MSFAIRPALPSDAGAIRSLHLQAFPGAAEAELVEQLDADGDTAISLVADDAGAIVGHVLFSRMTVEADGRKVSALGLAPVTVLPERQREGIGSRLIAAGLQEARALGSEMIFVLGDPAYYGRFGFAADTAVAFASPYAGPYFQAMVFNRGGAAPEAGRADYAPAFAQLA